jgi:hypothetical protein
MTERKFYETKVVVTILSEEELNPNLDLEQLHYAIRDGDCSGQTEIMEPKTLNGKEAVKALLNQASDPSFFRLTDDGEDLED